MSVEDCIHYGDCDISVHCSDFCKHYERGRRMNKKTKDFLGSLEKLLYSYDASIIRSANSTNDLVISVQVSPGEFEELYFAEEIGTERIKNRWWSI